MARILDRDHALPAVAAMLGCCDVDGGPTGEQLAFINALARGYFHVGDDLELTTIEPLGPDEVGAAFATAPERRRVHQLLTVTELCRHPLTTAQVDRVDAYAAALGVDEVGMQLARELATQGVAAAEADFRRSLMALEPGLREPTLAGVAGSAPTMSDPALVERLRALADCPDGSLGRAYLDFYERYGFALPGSDDQPAAIFVAHDMSHVISGYEPVGVGEIALGMMQIGVRDCDEHWIQLLGNFGVHEAGFVAKGAHLATLAQPGAAAFVAEAFDRGVRCEQDFTLVDHLALVDQPLEDVRAEFGIPPLRS